MSEEVISVIVPVYNVEMYLSTCLDSILAQDYQNLEIIVVNDGSTDFSLKIAEAYAEKEDRITVYTHKNEGLSEARNRGLAVATGDYITFVDSDDLLCPNSLSVMMTALKESHADMVEGKVIRGKVMPHTFQNFKFKSVAYSPKEAIADVLYQKRLLPSVCGKLFKRNLFDDISFEKGIIYEDLNIFYHILEKCHKILWIDFPVYFYRDTEGSIINTWKPQRLDVLKVTEKIENYIQEKYPDILPAAKDRRLSANFNIFSLCDINGEKENADRCWKIIRSLRKESFFNRNVRIKNKAGILLSYLGRPVFSLISRSFYKNKI